MRISINPITVPTETGDVICTLADVSVAVSNSTAIRLVPVDSSGVEYLDASLGIVGTDQEIDIAEFMAAVSAAVSLLAHSRGI